MIPRRILKAFAFVAATSLVMGGAVFWIGLDSILTELARLQGIVQAKPVLSSLVLFGWSFVLFLTVVPLGTMSVLIAGALLGGWVGWVQFVALVIASWVVFESGFASKRAYARANTNDQTNMRELLEQLAGRGIVATGFLRLVPVIPSAACSIICVGLAIPLRKFLAGTLLVGWVRPLVFAYIGAAAESSELIERFYGVWPTM